MVTKDEAIRNIRKALRTNRDTLNIAAGRTKDNYVIWRTSGSWTGTAEVTIGDLKALVSDA